MSSNSKLVIRLGMDDLERLLGGTDEAVVDLRQSIVEQFARRHLKSVANTPEMQIAMLDITQQVSKAIADEFTEIVKDGGRWKVVLRPEVVKEIKEAAQFEVQSQVIAACMPVIREEIESARNLVMGRVEQLIASHLEKLIPQGIEKMVEAEVQRRLTAIGRAIQEGEK